MPKTTKNSFDGQRLRQLIKYYMVTEWRSIVLTAVAIIGLIVCLDFLIGFFGGSHSDENTARSYEMTFAVKVAFDFIFLYVFGIISASFAFGNLRSKTSRITALTMPATTFEKYLARMVITVVGFYAVYLLAVFLGDCARCLGIFVVGGEGDYYFMSYDRMYDSCSRALQNIIIFMTTGFLTQQATYVLGASIWPKLGLVYTTLWQVGMNFVIGILLCVVMLLMWIPTDMNQVPYIVTIMPHFEEWVMQLNILWGVIYGLLCYLLSYYRIREIELIQRW